MFLSKGVNKNILTADGKTILYVAAQNGFEEVVKLLLRAGSDPNKPNKDGATPIQIATQNKHDQIVDLLVRAGGDAHLNPKSSAKAQLSELEDALVVACESGQTQMVEFFLDAGIK